jgi:hypothetical protein
MSSKRIYIYMSFCSLVSRYLPFAFISDACQVHKNREHYLIATEIQRCIKILVSKLHAEVISNYIMISFRNITFISGT